MAKIAERKGSNIILDRRDPHAFDGKCEKCGKVEELRPFGPNGENVCFECAMKDEAAATRMFKKHIEKAANPPKEPPPRPRRRLVR